GRRSLEHFDRLDRRRGFCSDLRHMLHDRFNRRGSLDRALAGLATVDALAMLVRVVATLLAVALATIAAVPVAAAPPLPAVASVATELSVGGGVGGDRRCRVLGGRGGNLGGFGAGLAAVPRAIAAIEPIAALSALSTVRAIAAVESAAVAIAVEPA